MGRSDKNGAIPDGWRIARLGDVATLRPSQQDSDTDNDLPYVGLKHIANGGTLISTDAAGDYISLKTRFEAGDTLFGKLRPNLRKVVRAPFNGMSSTEILAIVARSPADKNFLSYVLRSDPMHNHTMQGITGTKMPRASWSHMKNYGFLLPPLREQRAIAAVLDSVDEAIERTETVIAATEQVRDSLLHELLTRGVPGWHMEWREVPGVGTIPACWEVVRLGEVTEVRNGTTPSRARLDYWQVDEVPFVKTGQVNDVFIVEPDEFITSQAVTAGAVVVPKGSVLIAMIGQGKTRGMTARLGFDAAINQNFAAVYGADEDFSLEFFFAWARHNYSVIRALGQGSNQDALNCALIEGMRSPKPPVAEQRAITAMLDSIDEAIKQTRNEREELQSLKASAADALLTGRMRVSSRTDKH